MPSSPVRPGAARVGTSLLSVNETGVRKMLELHVVPEQLIGDDQWEFVLGMHFAQIVAILKSQATTIGNVKFIYNAQNPLLDDMVLDLVNDGIALFFCPRAQRLRRIEVYNMDKVVLKFNNTDYFNKRPQVTPTLSHISHVFGPTNPFVIKSENGRPILVMTFRGLCFIFPVDRTNDPQRQSEDGLNVVSYAQETAPVLSKMVVFSGLDLSANVLARLPLHCYVGNIYAEYVKVLRSGVHTTGLEVCVAYEPCGREDRGQTPERKVSVLRFGDSTQAIQSALGSPCKIHFKPDEKIYCLHAADPARNSYEDRPADYFYNYFTLGLDVVFDANCHTVKKFILHTNFPEHYDFELYHRCNFEVFLGSNGGSGSADALDLSSAGATASDTVSSAGASAAAATTASAGAMYAMADTPDVDPSSSSMVEFSMQQGMLVNSCTKWEEIVAFRGGHRSFSPIVVIRNDSTNANNLFGNSCCYCYQNIIFDTIRPSGHIATVTLYPSGS
ncbi:PHAF1 protein CG7083-like [Sycon ciliatum]|uniref:PHAF1 protein CG7083-like n=1 Tax=Sycon ciliatum TaxID=27933 RepID=UPI0031F66197